MRDGRVARHTGRNPPLIRRISAAGLPMEQAVERRDAPHPVETLHTPEGKPLGRVVAPRPGPVIGRAAGTVYLRRTPGGSAAPGFCPERGAGTGPR